MSQPYKRRNVPPVYDAAWFAAEFGNVQRSQSGLLQLTGGSVTGPITGNGKRIASAMATGVSTSGFVDLSLAPSGNGFVGTLLVGNFESANAVTSTQQIIALAGRGTSFSTTVLHTRNGTTAAAAFTVSVPSSGVVRVTNNLAQPTDIQITFYGQDGT
jgi:hypothetical protein